MELSKRLTAIAAMVHPGERLADIGTDHGYLPIYLVKQGIVPSAIAMDINDGPLARAAAHVKEFELEEKIILRKSDGLAALSPGEADTAVIAGMGGLLMIRILENDRETAGSLKRLILSPQSETAQVRRYLMKNGFMILGEQMVFDEGKYYLILETERGSEETPWSPAEEAYGRYLLDSGSAVVKEFLEKEQRTYREIREKLLTAGTDRAGERLGEMEEKLALVCEAMELFGKEEHR